MLNIEIAIQIMSWVGVLTCTSIFTWLLLWFTLLSYRKVMSYKSVCMTIYNDSINKSLSNTTREQMDAWLLRMGERWKEANEFR